MLLFWNEDGLFLQGTGFIVWIYFAPKMLIRECPQKKTVYGK